jgi:hypothetical protein
LGKQKVYWLQGVLSDKWKEFKGIGKTDSYEISKYEPYKKGESQQ